MEGERFTLCLLLALRFVFWKYLLRRLNRATFLFSFYIDPENKIKIDPPFFELRGGCSNCKNWLQSLRYNAFSNVGRRSLLLARARGIFPPSEWRIGPWRAEYQAGNYANYIIEFAFSREITEASSTTLLSFSYCNTASVPDIPETAEKSLCSPRASPGPRINSLMTCNIATWKI